MTDQLISKLLLDVQTTKQDVAQVKTQISRVLTDHARITSEVAQVKSLIERILGEHQQITSEHQHLLGSSSYELANDAAAMLLPLQFSDIFTGGGGL
jgi:hypothetical protein